jgi:cyclophilin family peptidyl-prolyl cis-trans isomerase
MRSHLSKIWKRLCKLQFRPRTRPIQNRRRPLSLEALEARLTPSVVGVPNTAPGLIAGTAYIDANHDGVLDAGDTGLPGLTVTLTGTTSSGAAVNVKTATNAGGAFSFRNVQPGTYTLTRSALGGFSAGTANFGTLGGTVAGGTIAAISVGEGQVGLKYNFGMFQLPTTSGVSLRNFTGSPTIPLPPAGVGVSSSDGSVGPAAITAGTGSLAGTIYFDANNNGIKDAGDTGLAGILVTMTGISDQGASLYFTTTTNASGGYKFAGLRAGTYTISTPNLPAKYVAGMDHAGSLGGFLIRNSQIADITIGTGQAGTGYNFGELHRQAVSGTGIVAQLADDTFGAGVANGTTDTITSDATIVGSVVGSGAIKTLTAGFGTPTTSILANRAPSGVFILDLALLTQINGSALADGPHTLSLKATDAAGHIFTTTVTFTLQTANVPLSGLALGTDNRGGTFAPSSGLRTTTGAGNSIVGAAGATAAGAQVVLVLGNGAAMTTTAGPDGSFSFSLPTLAAGVTNFTLTATDNAGNLHFVSSFVVNDQSGTTGDLRTFNGTFANTGMTITFVGSPVGLFAGQGISGAGIAAGTTITAVGTHTITLSTATTAASTGGVAGETLTVGLPTMNFTLAGQTVSATESGNTVTITTAAPINLKVGQTVTIAGVGTGYNGTFTVLSILANNKFTYTASSTGLAPGTAGTVTAGAISFDLDQFFTNGNVTNSVVQFNTSSGLIDVTLDDSATPATVANFFAYINSGAYNNDIFSRLVQGFVLQGGGATFSQSGSTGSLTPVTTQPGVVNEFGASRSNIKGTLALAQSAGNINSGTSQFFFNIANNSGSLDPQKFTVFGNLGDGFAQRTVNTLITYPTKNESAHPVSGVDLQNLPLKNYTGTSFPTDTTAANYALISSVNALRRTEAFTYSIFSGPNAAVATATVTNGNLVITPVGAGSTSITIRVTDLAGVTFDQVVPISVGPPTAANDSFATSGDGTLTVPATGVLANDHGSGLTVNSPGTITTAHGSATINADGSFTYTPVAGFRGVDTFNYTAKDSNGQISNVATVSITVNPVAVNDTFNATAGNVLNIGATGVLANDTGTALTVSTTGTFATTQGGSVTVNANGSFTYTPPTGFSGTDTFTYKDTDSSSNISNTATVTITVTPSAVNDSFTTTSGTALNVAATGVLANDTGTALTVSTTGTIATAQGGSVTINANGSFNYTPPAGFSGTDTFTYKDTDSHSILSNVATVTITVTPVAVNDTFTTTAGTALNVGGTGVLANDTGTALTVSAAGTIPTTQGGSVTINSNGTFIYTPPAGFSGTDTFTYKNTDGTSLSNVATVSITVTPVAVNDTFAAMADTTTNVSAAGVGGQHDGDHGHHARRVGDDQFGWFVQLHAHDGLHGRRYLRLHRHRFQQPKLEQRHGYAQRQLRQRRAPLNTWPAGQQRKTPACFSIEASPGFSFAGPTVCDETALCSRRLHA